MHNMHDRSKRSTFTATQTTKQVHEPRRTGPLNVEQQHRIEMRAAKAMEKQLKRRHDRRFLCIWGDRKKASIKWFPDGTFEILVPQTLTPEQEHYEFPLRSRFLKELATSTAERKRVIQDDGDDEHDHVNQHHSISRMKIMPTTITQPPASVPVSPIKKPDHDAMAEWFRQKTSTTAESGTATTNRRKKKTSTLTGSYATTITTTTTTVAAVTTRTRTRTRTATTAASPPPQSIQLHSETAKRRARSISSLLAPPPEDSVHKHYVPLSLLRHESTPDRKLPKQQQQQKGLVKLVDVFHQKMHEQQRLVHRRQQKQQQQNSSSSSRKMITLHNPTTTALGTLTSPANRKSSNNSHRSISTASMPATPISNYASRKSARPTINSITKTNSSSRSHPNSCKKQPLPYLYQQPPIRPARAIPAYTS